MRLITWLSGPVGWWLFSTAVASLPKPKAKERWYKAFYTFAQTLGANHSLVKSNKV